MKEKKTKNGQYIAYIFSTFSTHQASRKVNKSTYCLPSGPSGILALPADVVRFPTCQIFMMAVNGRKTQQKISFEGVVMISKTVCNTFLHFLY